MNSLTQKQIEEYREKLDLQLKEKSNDIESNISIVIIGALGFFLTINEKFVGLVGSKNSCLFVLSIVFLVISFVLFFVSKHLTTKYDRNLIDYIDDKLIPDDPQTASILLSNWDKYDKTLRKIRDSIYITLVLGVAIEVVFLSINILKSEPKIEKPIRIELKISNEKNDTTKILIKTDSSLILSTPKMPI